VVGNAIAVASGLGGGGGGAAANGKPCENRSCSWLCCATAICWTGDGTGMHEKKIVEKEAWHAFSGEEVQRADRECERAAAYLSTALTRFMATARRAASNAARKEAFSLFFFFFFLVCDVQDMCTDGARAQRTYSSCVCEFRTPNLRAFS
jgi:hypothetical protein